MRSLLVSENKNFVGRSYELEKLESIGNKDEASIIVMYGRRRIGKTELLEQAFRQRNIIKFEGIEGLNGKEQLRSVLRQLVLYTDDPLPQVQTWEEFFRVLSTYTSKGTWTIYLEELQWLAAYKGTLISQLKYAWDNYFRHNPKLLLILCGSAPSFMIQKVLQSKALYNRSQYEIPLKEFNIIEAKEFLKGRSDKEVFDAYLTVGGIPEYLKWVNRDSSLFLGLCNNSFTSGSFFSREYTRVFTSSLSKNKHYQEIIEVLSEKRFLSRDDLASHLKISSGGTLSSLLLDLENCGFIEKYHPFNVGTNSTITRYGISDSYLHYYFKFISPIEKNIDQGVYNQNPKGALKTDSYYKWLGFSFEKWCRKYHYIIAKILGFSGVNYRSGVFFSRTTDQKDKGYQIDLVFERADHVLTICEIKYLQSKAPKSVIDDFEKKLSLFPNKKNKTIHKVLICPEGAEDSLLKASYFDDIVTFSELMDQRYW